MQYREYISARLGSSGISRCLLSVAYLYILLAFGRACDAGRFWHAVGACVSVGRLGGFWRVGLTASAVKPEGQKSRAGKPERRGRWRTDKV